ncbi:MAG: hypothetical protein JSS83_28365 [Cyanobacteria bacterium SZAS LIN-3]|nr:hypothetical protein [Cyanobacteria bacterium SZAS LIN-3]
MFEHKDSSGVSQPSEDHTDSLAYYNGREALDAAQFADAANNFTLLIERHPRDPQYRWMRAKAYYGLGAWDLCRQDCDLAAELGLTLPEVRQLAEMAITEAHTSGNRGAGKPDFMALLALRHNYRLRSLFINADERLAEGDYNGVLELVTLAERLLDNGDASGDLAFNLGLMRVRACIGSGKQGEALEVIDFYIKHAQATGRDDYVRQFKVQRSLLY